MFPLTLRETKGSPLTHQEMDNNLKHVIFPPFLHIHDQKPQGTNGGTFTAGAWRTRDLNTVLTNTITGASLANNQITLPAGNYYVEASAPACSQLTGNIRDHKVRLFNTTTETEILVGSSEATRSSNDYRQISTRSILMGIVELADTNIMRLEHQCGVTEATVGLGRATNFTTEVYSDIRIWRISEYEE